MFVKENNIPNISIEGIGETGISVILKDLFHISLTSIYIRMYIHVYIYVLKNILVNTFFPRMSYSEYNFISHTSAMTC